jgi:predicted membrane-bound spermidine synthase
MEEDNKMVEDNKMEEDIKIVEYIENKEEYVEHRFSNCIIHDSIHTMRGTHVEMVERPNIGICCYMDNVIQSCQIDEKIYHEALVHSAMSSVNNPRRVLILGGGEGATAREVLKYQSVEKVDMYEWDKDVVELFSKKYPTWSNGVWEDNRLSVYFEDVFNIITIYSSNTNDDKISSSEIYDVIIIDLFEPDNHDTKLWYLFMKLLSSRLMDEGSMVMYSGMRNIFTNQIPHEQLMDVACSFDAMKCGYRLNNLRRNRTLLSFKVYIPSFLGEATFLLVKHNNINQQWNQLPFPCHIIPAVWNSYCTWYSFGR